jgi:hypothetical protein
MARKLSPVMMNMLDAFARNRGWQYLNSGRTGTRVALMDRGLVEYGRHDGEMGHYLTAAGWAAAGTERPADAVGRLTPAEALEEVERLAASHEEISATAEAYLLSQHFFGTTPSTPRGSVTGVRGANKITVQVNGAPEVWKVQPGHAWKTGDDVVKICGDVFSASWTYPLTEYQPDLAGTLADGTAFIADFKTDADRLPFHDCYDLGHTRCSESNPAPRAAQAVQEGDEVELSWKLSGSKATGWIEQITDDSVSYRLPGDGQPGTSYSAVYRDAVKIRVIRTVEEQRLGRRQFLADALEEAYPGTPIVWRRTEGSGYRGRSNGVELVSLSWKSRRTDPNYVVSTVLPVYVPEHLRGHNDALTAQRMAEELVTAWLAGIGAQWAEPGR